MVDLLSLRKSYRLSQVLKQLFSTRLIVGFGFQTDLLQIKQFIVENAFDSTLAPAFESITRFIDLQDLLHKELKLANPPRLQFVVEEAYKSGNCFVQEPEFEGSLTMCKIEQMSNWERRPLR